MEPYVERPFRTARSFMNALSRLNRSWAPHPNMWIFRGHAEAHWDLVPKSHRPETELSIRPRAVDPPRTEEEQAGLELQVLLDFVSRMSLAGFSLPSTAVSFIETIYEPDRARGASPLHQQGSELGQAPTPEKQARLLADWPSRELWEVLAIGGHHGMPTRLLDWTYDPLVAAYFAAEKASASHIKKRQRGRRLAVWALNRGEVARLLPLAGRTLQEVHVSAERNPNMKAQKGLFTLLKRDTSGSAQLPLQSQSLVEHLRTVQAHTFSPFPEPATILQKLTLPYTQSRALLRYLYESFITAEVIFPGIDGLVRAMAEARRWPEP